MDITKVKTPEQLMEFMKENIEYGFIGTDGVKRIETLDGFREFYRTSTVSEILEQKLGTCIETGTLAKQWFEMMGIPCRLFCNRGYEEQDNFGKKIRMHILIFYYLEGNLFHFEFSNRQIQGIHQYDNIEVAIKKLTEGFIFLGDEREVSEIEEIPSGLSFKEFNSFVNKSTKLDDDFTRN